MSKIKSFLEDKSDIKIFFVSVILALALASLFRKSCLDNNCVIVEGPSYKELKDKIFKFDNKCYTYHKESTPCKKE